MKQSHIIYMVVGLTIMMVFMISGCGQIKTGGRDAFLLLWTGLIILLVGGGSFVNLSERKLSFWPTTAMIIGYSISFFLIPLGIWGAVILMAERKRKRDKKPGPALTKRNPPAELPPLRK